MIGAGDDQAESAESMKVVAWRRIAAALVALAALGACGSKGTLDDSREERVRVEGRTYEVRIAKTDMPNTWRMLIVRATVAIAPDPELERMRAENVAKPFMERTCKGRPFSQIMDKLQDNVNYYTLFKCGPPA